MLESMNLANLDDKLEPSQHLTYCLWSYVLNCVIEITFVQPYQLKCLIKNH